MRKPFEWFFNGFALMVFIVGIAGGVIYHSWFDVISASLMAFIYYRLSHWLLNRRFGPK